MPTNPANAVFAPRSRAADWRRWLAVTLTAGLWLAALIFGARRLAGALSTPLDAAALVSVGLAAAGLAALARRLAPAGRGWTSVGVTVPLLLLALAMSLPGTSAAGLVLLWSVVGAEELWGWWLSHAEKGPRVARPEEGSPATAIDPPPVAVEPAAEACSATSSERDEEGPDDDLPAADVLQQLTRSRLPDGGEAFSGWLRIPLAASQRSTNVHLSFCPAFAQTPKIAIDQQAGPKARIRPVQVLPYGARFDLKLAQACETDTAIVLHFVAEAPAAALKRP